MEEDNHKEDNTNWKTRIEDNILILETNLQQKEKECSDIRKQIDILKNLIMEYSSMSNGIDDVSQSLKTKVTLIRLQKQYGTDILSQDTFKQHNTVPITKNSYKPSNDKNKQVTLNNTSSTTSIEAISNDNNIQQNEQSLSPSKIPMHPKTTKNIPPTPPPQYPISIAQKTNNKNKISIMSQNQIINENYNRPAYSQFFGFNQSPTHQINTIQETPINKYADMNLSGNLKDFIQYNNVPRNYKQQKLITPV